ncbi:agouti-signaling protein [Protopterus annectens]|uniref:agouti-signaling protein n=1 Tax=Protopterus annectens TaxID=7888 RepID=UPI001CF9AC9B|nr:agouti-signaling protein [Protopterus annectens]
MLSFFYTTRLLKIIMEVKKMILAFLVSSICFISTFSHIVFEEQTTNSLQLPAIKAIEIVELTKSSRKTVRKDVEKKKSQKNGVVKKTKPANCAETWDNCKVHSVPCCNPCAYCQCRLLRTICFCKMTNPNC